MKVRIQLIRDDGNVVMDVHGEAWQTLRWAMPYPSGFYVLENGTKMSGFAYAPHMCDFSVTNEASEAVVKTVAIVGD